jgi:phosphoribosylformimino-5-aminoimidazole carboxamide ribotide isomerase
MIIIPAVDIKEGKCVRLLQGRMDAETVFSDDPESMALRWAQEGAALIHVVDLDGAVAHRPRNGAVIKKIVRRLAVDIQVGGGIRTEAAIQDYLDAGVKRVIIGTEAVRNPKMVKAACLRFPGQILLGIDARDGLAAIEGWTQTTKIRAVDLAKAFEDYGVAGINFTDIHRDGMQTGPNIEETKQLAEAVSIPVFASGGVSTIEDIKNLLPLESVGVAGVITGRALYSGALDLKEAISISKSSNTTSKP